MDEISDLALQKILELIPFKDRKICRLVCQRWKKEIEGCETIGLSVRIDSREQESGILEFLQNVIVKEVEICALVNNPMEEIWLTLKLDYTKTLALSGYTDPFFVSSRILRTGYFNQLTKLYFCGTFLIGQELTQAHDIQPLVTTCCFPVLRELYLVLPRSTLADADAYILELPGILIPRFPIGVPDMGHLQKVLSERVNRNAAYLLGVIHSHQLKVLEVMIGTVCFWNLEPLYKLIEEQGSHLTQLVVSPQSDYYRFQGNPPMRFPDANRKFSPKNSLRSLHSIYLHNLHPTQQFWKDFVEVQEQLEQLHLHFSTFPKRNFNAFLTTLVTQNHETIKCLRIKADASGQRTEGLEVDMKLFCIAERLEILEISTKGRNKKKYPSVPWRNYLPCGGPPLHPYYPQYPVNFRMKSINDLPRNLKLFETSFLTCEEFDGAKFLRETVHMEELKLTCIQRVGLMKERLQVTEFFKTGLRHRQLDRFDIEFMLPEPVPPDIGGSWQNTRPLSFNNRHSSYQGYLQSESDCIEGLLCGKWLVEKFYLGDSLWQYCRVYIRNYFEAIDTGLLSRELHLHRNPRVSYVKVPCNFVRQEELVKKYGGTPPLSFSDCSWPPDYHSVLNLTTDLQKETWMNTELLADTTSWSGPEPNDWKKRPYAEHLELEPDTDHEDDANQDEEDDEPIVLSQGSEIPEFLISRPFTKMEKYFCFPDPETEVSESKQNEADKESNSVKQSHKPKRLPMQEKVREVTAVELEIVDWFPQVLGSLELSESEYDSDST